MHCASLHKRRNLTADQRAMVGACVAEKYRELTKARQVAAGEARARGPREEDGTLAKKEACDEDADNGQTSLAPVNAKLDSEGPKQTRAPKASALAAREVGASARQVERAIAIRKVDPALADRVTSGEMKLKQAERVKMLFYLHRLFQPKIAIELIWVKMGEDPSLLILILSLNSFLKGFHLHPSSPRALW